MHSNIHRRSALALALGAALFASACGGSSGASASAETDYDCANPNADSTTSISVAMMPILSAGAMHLGNEQGYFARNGIKLEVEEVSAIPAAIAAVQGGSADFGFTGTIPLLQALQGGIPVKIIAPYAGIAPDYYDKMKAGEEGYTTEVTALLTMKDSGLSSPGDLSNKTVAVNDVQGQSELTARYVIDENGGDSSTVKFVVMPPADAYNALLAGKVDAAQSGVPMILDADQKGAQVVSWSGVETLHEGPTSVLIASDSYITSNAETVARFNCAVRESTSYASGHPDEVRAAYARAADVAPETVASSVVPYFYDTVDVAGIKRFEDLMLDYGFLRGPIDLNGAIDPVATK
ncbi:ABC transporter substrate-binding protein [Streptomyces sp. NPDC004610]|uniref:ABC transporter substrate-binding protein n=1 Tax=unclassified Streptomyces TaxID=2593676 RepID=UPI0033BE4F9B